MEESVSEKQKAALKKNWKIRRIDFDETKVVLQDLLRSMSGSIDTYNQSIDSIIQQLEDSVKTLKKECSMVFDEWDKKYYAHKVLVSKTLRDQGFDSPEQLLNKVENLREQIDKIEREDVPRLKGISDEIETLTQFRNTFLGQFKTISEIIAQTRNTKIEELN
jgi:archaellum component FlaC